MNFPYITIEQMAEVDRLAVENGLEIKQMMEYAGLNIARFTQRYVEPSGSILILCGKGHNGGDGLAAARHLINWGYKVCIVLAVPADELKETSRVHYDLLQKMNADFGEFSSDFDVIVDALLGYNIDGNPREKYADLIEKANASDAKILAVDMASGFGFEPMIEAETTITLALPKTNLKNVQNLYVADLGIPDFVYEKADIEVPVGLFKDESIVKIS